MGIDPDQIDQRETFTNIKEAAIIDNEIDKLAQIGVIEKANHCEGEFISTIFLRPKSDGTHRMILNLNFFNKSINYVHFKMESYINYYTKFLHGFIRHSSRLLFSKC